MNKHLSSVCLGVAAAALAFTFMSTEPVTGQQASAKQKWEYKSVQVSDQDAKTQLNKLGDEGWELVTLERPNGYVGATFYFKRPN